MDGLLIVDKPVGPTSHDVVARVRRALGERRIGHTGTLDPMASGVLPLVLGRATRLARFLSATEKTYIALVRLGMDDRLARCRWTAGWRSVRRRHARSRRDRTRAGQSSRDVSAAAASVFRQEDRRHPEPRPGETAARRALDLARGPPARVARPVSVTVSDLRFLRIDGTDVELAMTCSAGFYVRSLAHDLGQRLGTGAHLAALRRTRAGDLRLEDAVALDAIVGDDEGRLSGSDPDGPHADDAAGGRAERRGGPPCAARAIAWTRRLLRSLPQAASGFTRLLDSSGDLVGVAEPERGPGVLHPLVILV